MLKTWITNVIQAFLKALHLFFCDWCLCLWSLIGTYGETLPQTHLPPSLLTCTRILYTPRKWTDLIHRAWGATLKGFSLHPWQIVKKQVVSISENHALVCLPLLGTVWSFDKVFNGWKCSIKIRTFTLYRYYSEIGFSWFVIGPTLEPWGTPHIFLKPSTITMSFLFSWQYISKSDLSMLCPHCLHLCLPYVIYFMYIIYFIICFMMQTCSKHAPQDSCSHTKTHKMHREILTLKKHAAINHLKHKSSLRNASDKNSPPESSST